MKTFREQRAAQIQDVIRQVLFHDGDPIGVNSNPKLADEYDRCIAPVYRILVESRSEDALIELLRRMEHVQIGAAGEPSEQLRAVAQKLLAWDVTLENRD